MKQILSYRKVLGVLLLFGNLTVMAQAQKQMEIVYGNFTSFSKNQKNEAAWEKYNSADYKKHPEFGKNPFNGNYAGYVEVLEKRKEDERYFMNENNPKEFYLQKAYGALHYKKDNQWITIDHHIAPKGNDIYEASNQYDPVGFDVKQALSYIVTPEGTVYFNNWKLYGRNEDGDDVLLENPNWANYTAGDDGLYFANFFDGIDAQMQVTRGSIETNFIVKKFNYAGYKYLFFKDEFKTPYAASFEFDGDAHFSKMASSNVKLKTSLANLLEINQAVAYVKDNSRDKAINPEYVINNSSLGLLVPIKWIEDNIHTNDLIIDPLVTSSNTLAQASITGSMYNTSCNFVNSCDYSLTVNTPAMATFTDILWTFTYKAYAAQVCYLSDGAVTFQIGNNTCQSPSYTGNPATQLYWFCNSPSSGTCAGSNVSIFSDIGSCLPAPSCSAQPVTFKMNFYRDCWSSTGCSSTCIGANSPWTMTIQGHTIEFSSTATPVSVSSSTVCPGQTFTATTAAGYGVPAITYNWSTNSSGTPSIGTGTSIPVTFTAGGTYTVYCIATDACSQTVTASQTVTVNSVSVTASASPSSICAGQTSTLTTSGASSYTWSPSASLSSSNGATVTATPSVTTDYTVIGSVGTCTASAITTVSVTPSPVIVANSATVCAGDSAILAASGASTYTWNPTTALNINATGDTAKSGVTTTTIYTVTGANGLCLASPVTATVTVNPSPTVTVNSLSICLGDSAVLAANGATSYTWNPTTALNINATGDTAKAGVTSTTIYTVTGSIGACTSSATSTVTLISSPAITVNSATICVGDSAVLVASGANTYTWSPLTSLQMNPTNDTAKSGATSTTIYTVTGAVGSCIATPATATVTVNSLPTVSVNSATICSGDSAALTANGASAYAWLPPTALSTTTGSMVVSHATVTTDYTVTGTDANGCKDSAVANITVNQTPTLTSTSATVCVGDSTLLTVSGASSYTWNPSTDLHLNITGDTATSGALVTETYTVTGAIGNCFDSTTVTATIIPAVTLTITPSANPICSGMIDTLIASGADTYTWSTMENADSIVVAPTTGTISYTVNGTIGTCSAVPGVVTVTVVPTPTLAVNNDTTVCSGSMVTLWASGATTYVWADSTLTPIAMTATTVVTPTVTQTYYVGGMNGTCLTTDSVKITVNPLPTLTVTNTGAICSGQQTATLTATGASTYTWSPSADLNTNMGDSVISNATVTTTYTVTGTDGNGCSNTGSTSLTVNTPPTVTSSSVSVCVNNTATLTANGASTYTWAPNAGLSSPTGSPVTITPTSTGVTTYTVIGTDANGCFGDAAVDLMVNDLPNVSASINPNPICVNSTTTLTASGANTYTWSPSAGLSSANGSQVTTTPSSTASITYTVSGADANGCINTGIATLMANPLPVLATSASPSTVCLGNSSQLLVSGGVNYVWSPATSLTGATTSNPMATPTSNTNYTVVGTDANGCSSTKVVTVSTSSVAAMFTADPETGDAPLNVNFTNTSTGATTYTWNYGTGTPQTTSSMATQTTTYSVAGTYTVILTVSNANACVDTATAIIVVNEGYTISIPNIFTPNGDGVNDVWFVKNTGVSSMSIFIYDRWGLKVWEGGSASSMWDGGKEKDGTYFYVIKATDNKGTTNDYKGDITLIR